MLALVVVEAFGGMASPFVVSVALACLYQWSSPLAGDLAAQTARGQLFSRSGLVAWWGGWYSGLGTSSYSLISPVLLGWMGPVLLGALSIAATPLAATPLLKRSARPVLGGLLLCLTAAADVVAGRATLAFGLVVALLSASAALSSKNWLSWPLACAATFVSPVAGLLLFLVSLAGLIAQPVQRRQWVGVALSCVLAFLILQWLAAGLPTGVEPFGPLDLLLAEAAAALVAVLPTSRVVRAAALCTAIALLAAYLVPNPVGTNLTRIVLVGAAPPWPRRHALGVVCCSSSLSAWRSSGDQRCDRCLRGRPAQQLGGLR